MITGKRASALSNQDRDLQTEAWRWLVAPDWVLPAQQPHRFRSPSPQYRLAAAVMERALLDLESVRGLAGPRPHPRSHEAQQWELRDDLQAWFMADDREWPFSFVTLCEHLGLDAAAIRKELSRRCWALADRRVFAIEGKHRNNRTAPRVYFSWRDKAKRRARQAARRSAGHRQ